MRLTRTSQAHELGRTAVRQLDGFAPGDRVRTIEGLLGTVTAVDEGFSQGAEYYDVLLDQGLGGGAYSSSELTSPDAHFAAAEAASEASYHVASEDYPELADILVERPPIERMAKQSSSWEVVDDQGHSQSGPVSNTDEAHQLADQLGGTIPPVTDQQEYAGWGTGTDATTEDFISTGARDNEIVTPVMIHTQAGWLNNRLPENVRYDPNGNYSYDWCRYRKKEHCFYPKELNYEATKIEGYSVWIPDDRGFCHRAKWDDQKTCPLGSPGPNSGEPLAFLDATIPYEDGGQRGGVGVHVKNSSSGLSLSEGYHGLVCPACQGNGVGGPFSLPQKGGSCGKCDGDGNVDARKLAAQYSLPDPDESMAAILLTAAADPDFSFHVESSWKDIQSKAKRIRSEGGVRILSATGAYLTAEVKGDSNVYQTTIVRVPGRKALATWECGCKWATYSWARSGRWKKYEGRQCAHALALTYEASAQEWMGGHVQEQAEKPPWAVSPALLPGDRSQPKPWMVGPPRRKSNLIKQAMPPIAKDADFHDIAVWYNNLAKKEEPATTRAITDLAAHNGGIPFGLQFRFKSVDKIEEKFHRKNKKLGQGDPRDWISDALRYTVLFHPAEYSAEVQDFMYGLEEKGFDILKGENSWMRGDSYSDLNFNLATPSQGLPIELQFHTSTSANLKNIKLHKLYEEFRSSSTPLRRKQELWDIMTKYWDDVEIPKDVMKWGETDEIKHKLFGRPASLRHQPATAEVAPSLIEAMAHGRVAGKPPKAKVQGREVTLLALLPDHEVLIEGDKAVPAEQVIHPKYDPTKGLRVGGAREVAGEPRNDGAELSCKWCDEAVAPRSDGQGWYHPRSSGGASCDGRGGHGVYSPSDVIKEGARQDWNAPCLDCHYRLGYGVWHPTVLSDDPAAHDEAIAANTGYQGLQPHQEARTASLHTAAEARCESCFQSFSYDEHEYDQFDEHTPIPNFCPKCEAWFKGQSEEEWARIAPERTSALHTADGTIDTSSPMAGEWGGARFYVDHSDDPADWHDPLADMSQDMDPLSTPDDGSWPYALEADAVLLDEPEPALPETYGDLEMESSLHFAGDGYTEPGTKAYDAHTELNNAVRDGKKSKPSKCSKCGGGGEIIGHHSNYDQPLNVSWLCKSCHGKEHAKKSSLQDGLDWLKNGSSSADEDIAHGARQFLAKTAGKVFSPAEQRLFIDEGSDGVTAANLGDLDIAGTHYQMLDEALTAQEGTLW